VVRAIGRTAKALERLEEPVDLVVGVWLRALVTPDPGDLGEADRHPTLPR
jgi:hypothetical protein